MAGVLDGWPREREILKTIWETQHDKRAFITRSFPELFKKRKSSGINLSG
jgi:hypothetical protein